jgi:hypothetical protein
VRSYSKMPSTVRDEIVAAAKRENSGDWKQSDMLELTRQRSNELIADAQRRYPKDWTMIASIAADEAKKPAK